MKKIESTNELIKAINPTIKPSFSPNLHKFLKAWRRRLPDYYMPEVWNDPETKMLMIGCHYKDEPIERASFGGLRLYSALCHGAKAYQEKACYMHLIPSKMEHITEFWERYLDVGRCAIDHEHKQWFIGGEGRFVMDGDVRTCTWCGLKHQRHIEVITTRKEEEVFTPITKVTS